MSNAGCIACGAGQRVPSEGATSSSECSCAYPSLQQEVVDEVSGEEYCECNPGYYWDDSSLSCVGCSADTYKSGYGNDITMCLPCVGGSLDVIGKVECDGNGLSYLMGTGDVDVGSGTVSTSSIVGGSFGFISIVAIVIVTAVLLKRRRVDRAEPVVRSVQKGPKARKSPFVSKSPFFQNATESNDAV